MTQYEQFMFIKKYGVPHTDNLLVTNSQIVHYAEHLFKK